MEQKFFEELVTLVFENNVLNEAGMMIIEHSRHTSLSHMMNFSFLKKYGGSIFSFFELEKDESEEPAERHFFDTEED
jgi:16S rRNA (guanine966-N2)-methyltransferase